MNLSDLISAPRQRLSDLFGGNDYVPEDTLLPARARPTAAGDQPEYDPAAPVAHYPHRRYADKKWAPSNNLTFADLDALADSHRTAVEKGVLSEELAQYLLPMALTEGRPASYGVMRGNAFYARPDTVDRFSKMGLTVADLVKGGAHNGEQMVVAKDKRGDPMLSIADTAPDGDHTMSARLMAAILAEKARKAANPEAAVKAYNGRGAGWEIFRDANGAETSRHPADVNVYWSKVQSARDMLQHPQNKTMIDHYTRRLRGQ